MGMIKMTKQIEEMILPDFLVKIPNGRFIVNFSDLKTQSRVFMLNHKEKITLEGFAQILIELKEKFGPREKVKRCGQCKGTVFEDVKEIEVDIFRFVDWRCLNCGNIEPARYLTEKFKKTLKEKEKEVDTDVVSTIEDTKTEEPNKEDD